MRIGFFTDAYRPIGFGVDTSIESFRHQLEKMGHEVFIFAPKCPKYKDINPNVFRFRSIRIIKTPAMRLALPFSPIDALGKLKDLPLDIVHSHTPFSIGILGKYVSHHQKIPLIYTHHTHYPEYAKFYIKEKLIVPKAAEHLIKWYSDFSKLVIAPSAKMKRLLREYGVKKQIVVLPTGIDANFFKKIKGLREKIRRKLKIENKQKVLLFVGRIGEEKNIGFLIKTFKEIIKEAPQTTLLIVGGGPELKDLKKISVELGIKKNVIFTGSIPHPQIPGIYQAADVFLFASLTDTQGIVILEAAASSLPVVALKDDAFSQMVVENKNGFLIEKDTPKIFALKVIEILTNPLLLRELSKNSLKIAKAFSEKSQTKKLLEIYNNLIQ